jgi:Protein of unknown function (DUF2934)
MVSAVPTAEVAKNWEWLLSDNPLQDTPERLSRIRDRAYKLWEEEGRPEGRDLEFWERAKELVGMEEHPTAGELPNPMTHPEQIPGVTVEEAELQENLGEFPDRLTDQGDRQEAPVARVSSRATKKKGATR